MLADLGMPAGRQVTDSLILDPEDPINDDRAAFWPLSGGNPLVHRDLRGRHKGTSTSGSFTTLRHGKGWVSGGGAVSIASPPAVTSPWTVSLRLRTTSTAQMDIFRAYEPGGAYTGWGIAIGYVNAPAPGRLGSYSKSNPGGGWVGATSSTYNDGVEHSIIVTYDGTTLRFYKDGEADGSGASAVPPLYTGAWAFNLPSGTVQQAVSLHRRVVNDSERHRLARNPWAGIVDPGLRLFHPLLRAAAGTPVETTAAGPGEVTVAGQAAFVAAGVAIAAGPGAVTIAGQLASVAAGVAVTAGAGAVAAAGQEASVAVGVAVQAGAGAVGIAGQAASVVAGVALQPGAGSITAAGQPASVIAGVVLAAGAGAVAIAGQAATVLAPAPYSVPASRTIRLPARSRARVLDARDRIVVLPARSRTIVLPGDRT